MSGSVLNIVIKLVAVLLAVLLWFNVITQKQYDYETTLPVTEIEYPPGLGAVDSIPDSLTVLVQAVGKKLLRGDWKEAGLRLKATRLRRGYGDLELNLETVSLVKPGDINLLNLKGPATFRMHLDRVDSILKPVASRLAVVPRDGYMVVEGQGGITPLQMNVIGPASLLGRFDSITTEPRILDDVTEPVELALALEIPDNLNVSLAHDSARIEVVVDRVKSRRFDAVPVALWGNPKAIVDPDRVTIDLRGPESMVDTLTAENVEVQVRPHPSMRDGYIVPQVTLPDNCTLERLTPDSLRIYISP